MPLWAYKMYGQEKFDTNNFLFLSHNKKSESIQKKKK